MVMHTACQCLCGQVRCLERSAERVRVCRDRFGDRGWPRIRLIFPFKSDSIWQWCSNNALHAYHYFRINQTISEHVLAHDYTGGVLSETCYCRPKTNIVICAIMVQVVAISNFDHEDGRAVRSYSDSHGQWAMMCGHSSLRHAETLRHGRSTSNPRKQP